MDLAMCKDLSCPSHEKCYRFVGPANDSFQTYLNFHREDHEEKCNYFIRATCCLTSSNEFGNGNSQGEIKECLFCNREMVWNGEFWETQYP